LTDNRGEELGLTKGVALGAKTGVGDGFEDRFGISIEPV